MIAETEWLKIRLRELLEIANYLLDQELYETYTEALQFAAEFSKRLKPE